MAIQTTGGRMIPGRVTGSQEVAGAHLPSFTIVGKRNNPCPLVKCSIRRQGYCLCEEVRGGE